MTYPASHARSVENTAHRGTPPSAEIVVFGETLVDEFPSERVIGGAPFNVARTLAALGCPPLLISRVGQDVAALEVIAELRKFGLAEAGLQTDRNHPTGLVKVEMSGSTHRFNILRDQAYDYIDGDAARATISSFFHGQLPRCIYFGTLVQRGEISRASLRGLLANADVLAFLDLNLRDGQFTSDVVAASLALADIVKLNEDELQHLLRHTVPGAGVVHVDLSNDSGRAALRSALLELARLFSLRAIIVTLGERGYVYLDQSGGMLYNQAQAAPIDMIDTVGCGDAFSAVFLTGLLRGWPAGLALERAHAFAASICTVRGAVAPDLAFYQRWLQQWHQEKEPA